MENKNNINVILSWVSFCSAIVSIFIMYYIFAGISFLTGILSINDERSRKMSITSIVIVSITIVIKIVSVILASGSLPMWLMNGIV